MPTRAQICTWIAVAGLLVPSVAAGQGRTEREIVELIVRDGPQARAIRAESEVTRREQEARLSYPNPSVTDVADDARAASDAPVLSDGLTKRFGRQTAVDAVDLVVPQGSVYGFLGPNGSGKTTTIRMLLGLVRPTAGSMRYSGRRSRPGTEVALPRVGALVEGPAFHPYLSGRANLLRLDAADRTSPPPRPRPGSTPPWSGSDSPPPPASVAALTPSA